MPLELFLDDILQLRKPHPCGSDQWRVVRLGADIGLRCLGCDRKVLLPRSTLVSEAANCCSCNSPRNTSSRGTHVSKMLFMTLLDPSLARWGAPFR